MKRLLLMLFLSALVLCAADVTGKWSGTFEAKSPDGETKSEPAFLILKQDGDTLTGSGGPNETEQHEMRNGKVEGNRVTFEIPLGDSGERVIKFDLTTDGDQISGNMSGPSKEGEALMAKISLKRVRG